MNHLTASSCCSWLYAIAVLLAGCSTIPTHTSNKPREDTVTLGGYSTRFQDGDEHRNHNITLATGRLDGTTIAPGATFSFNQTVGNRTAEAGYQIARTLSVTGDEPALGGGVCQVSSTLFNALLLADLELIERNAHSRPVHYVPPGRDATVSYGAKDLIFRNPHPFPVHIRGTVAGNRLTFLVTGPESLPYEVQLVTEDAEDASPRRVMEVVGTTQSRPDHWKLRAIYVKLYRIRVSSGVPFGKERISNTLVLTGLDRDEVRP
ncbi:MAG: VanW family protein [Myxococcales bacterium]|nr:VanW family protein [Myxococcales bacterium]